MQTKLLYNYKSADTELSARLSGLERKLSFGENENLEDKVGAAVEVRFDLVRDEDSPSGYLWTSSVGEHKPITAGSYCTGSNILEIGII